MALTTPNSRSAWIDCEHVFRSLKLKGMLLHVCLNSYFVANCSNDLDYVAVFHRVIVSNKNTRLRT